MTGGYRLDTSATSMARCAFAIAAPRLAFRRHPHPDSRHHQSRRGISESRAPRPAHDVLRAEYRRRDGHPRKAEAGRHPRRRDRAGHRHPGSYGRPGDYYRFYEINPLVLRLARTEFYFLRGLQGQVEVAMGDARLSLEREQPENFDVLAVDAFSSDSIPGPPADARGHAALFPPPTARRHSGGAYFEPVPGFAAGALEGETEALRKAARRGGHRGRRIAGCFRRHVGADHQPRHGVRRRGNPAFCGNRVQAEVSACGPTTTVIFSRS